MPVYIKVYMNKSCGNSLQVLMYKHMLYFEKKGKFKTFKIPFNKVKFDQV